MMNGYETTEYPNWDSGQDVYKRIEHKTLTVEVDGFLQYIDGFTGKVLRSEKVQMVWWKDQQRWDYASEASIVYAIQAEIKDAYSTFKHRIDMNTVDLLEIHSRKGA